MSSKGLFLLLLVIAVGSVLWGLSNVAVVFETYKTPQLKEPTWDMREVILINNQSLASLVNETLLKKKTIILWYIQPRYINETPALERLEDCDIATCYATTDKTYMQQSDVVMFNAQLIWHPDPPKRVSPDQVWVFHNQEPTTPWWIGSIKFRNEKWRGLFNWTMWYRRDADLFAPYSFVVKKEKTEKRNWTEVVRKKQNKAAWMVSNFGNAPSKRYEYVKMLMKYIDVDIYGENSKLKWPRGGTIDFVKMVGEKYKFYLSFENALCEDYISEKFFLYYQSDIIPIARGAGNYSKNAPYGTYINTADFKSVEALGKYLQYLMKNDTAYIELLKAKHPYTSKIKRYRTVVKGKVAYEHWMYETKAMCELCHRAKNIEKYRKSIKRIDHWFDQKKCWDPTDLH